jgi:hypothetical protein
MWLGLGAVVFLVGASSTSLACETQNVTEIVSASSYEDCSFKELAKAKESLLDRLRDLENEIQDSRLPDLAFKQRLPIIGGIKSSLSMIHACGAGIIFRRGPRTGMDAGLGIPIPSWCPAPDACDARFCDDDVEM